MTLAGLRDGYETGRVTRVAPTLWCLCRRHLEFLEFLDDNHRRLPRGRYPAPAADHPRSECAAQTAPVRSAICQDLGNCSEQLTRDKRGFSRMEIAAAPRL